MTKILNTALVRDQRLDISTLWEMKVKSGFKHLNPVIRKLLSRHRNKGTDQIDVK